MWFAFADLHGHLGAEAGRSRPAASASARASASAVPVPHRKSTSEYNCGLACYAACYECRTGPSPQNRSIDRFGFASPGPRLARLNRTKEIKGVANQ